MIECCGTQNIMREGAGQITNTDEAGKYESGIPMDVLRTPESP
jgi:hypothetical protein